MKTLDKIIGGKVNFNGGIDVNYQSTGLSVDHGGSIKNGYFDTGFRVREDGNIGNAYSMNTGVFVDSFGTIKRKF